jgi:hypothetical protein
VKKVWVNGQEAKPTQPNFAEWEIEIDVPTGNNPTVQAHAEDAAGNVEKRAHVVALK